MVPYPAVIVHGLADACVTLAVARPVVLLSAPGAAQYAGCSWWLALIARARADYPLVPVLDILDCADAPGLALGAIRAGQRALVLWPSNSGFAAVAAIAAARKLLLLSKAPPALDLAAPHGRSRLAGWLSG